MQKLFKATSFTGFCEYFWNIAENHVNSDDKTNELFFCFAFLFFSLQKQLLFI